MCALFQKSSFVVHRDSFMGLAGAGLERLPSPKELYGKRRRGAGRKVAPSNCRMVAVLRHIQDIKKLQGGIDLLKKDKWGGSSHLPPEESWPRGELDRGELAAGGAGEGRAGRGGSWRGESWPRGELERVQGRSGSTAPPRHRPAQREEEREGIPTADPFLPAFPVLPMQPFPLYPRDVPFYPSTQLHTNQQFPASQEEFCAAPGADPVSSYVMATADRQMAPEGFLTQPPHKEFWGFCFPSEE
ncbi:hypothetical protein HHUSO_G21728 [Huso huso]|uniref:BHLH domain-containing protein n=1 Tax=Huso huso TaxID=61971 RepID=A0ABR0YZK0_HUSHU